MYSQTAKTGARFVIRCSTPRTLENGNIQNYDTARFYRDGKLVLACGSEAAQTTRCYVQEMTGGPPHAVTPPGTTGGLVSPDGNPILARDTEGNFRSIL